MKRIIAAMTMILVSITMLSGCSKYYCFGFVDYCIPSKEERRRKEDLKTWDEEKTIPIAKSYLEEKYNEEFLYVSRVALARPYPKDLVVVCGFIRKADENVKKPMKYKVDVIYKSGEYTVVGDNYMFEYIQKVAEDFLRPYVEKRFSDIEHVFFLYKANTPCGELDGEYLADAKIPQSFDELCDVTSGINFRICVPVSEDQNKVSEACSLLKSDLEELTIGVQMECWIGIYQIYSFNRIRQSSNPKRDDEGTSRSLKQIM